MSNNENTKPVAKDKYMKNNGAIHSIAPAQKLLEQDQQKAEKSNSVNTEINNNANTEKSNDVKKGRKKMQFIDPVKATFVLESEIHKELKRAAVDEDRKMAELVADALVMYFEATRGYNRQS